MTPPANPVSRVVWPRDGRRAAGPDLRRAALVQAGVLAAAGALVRFGFGHAAIAWVVWGIGGLALALGVVRPAAFAPLHRLGRGLGRIAGTALTWLLLAPVHVVGFGLAAAVLRLRGADPMQRRPLPRDLTYWIPRRRSAETGDYGKQFRVEDPGARAERRPLHGADGPDAGDGR